MKTIIVRLSVVLFILCGFCACGGSSTKITMTNEDCEYSGNVLAWGDVDDFFEVVPGTYKISEKDGKLLLPVVVIKTKNEKLSGFTVEQFICSIGSDIDNYLKVKDKKVEFYASDKFTSYKELRDCSVGEKITIPFEYFADKEMFNAVKDALNPECKIIEISLDLEEIDEDSIEATSSKLPASTINDEKDEEDVTASSKSDWDAILDEYESFVDKYIALLKKANTGDMSALTEYMSYMEKAQALAEKLDDADDDMSSAQMNRYMKIAQKMATAAADAL